MKNSGFNDKSKVSTFNKVLYQTESEVLLNPLLLIHVTVGGHAKMQSTKTNGNKINEQEYVIIRN